MRFSGAIKYVSILGADKFIVEFATRITKNANYTTTRWQISIFGMNSVPLPLLSFLRNGKKNLRKNRRKKHASIFAWKSHNLFDWHFSLNHTPTISRQRRTRDILAEIITTPTILFQLSKNTFTMMLSSYMVK